jgi:drug/metabolite transporter (DMT)-like permease
MISNLLALLFISFSWGFSFVLIKYTENSIPPLTLMAERGIWGFIAMLILCLLLKRDIIGHAKHWLPLLTFAILGIAFTWVVVALGEEDVSGGLASVLVSINPLVTFIITVFILKEETLKLSSITGLIIGVAGLIMVIGLPNILAGGTVLNGVLLISIGFTAFAISGILIRKTAAETDPVVATTYFVGMATVVMCIMAFIFEDPLHTDLSELDLVLEAILGVFCFSIAFIVYYWLINNAGVFFASLTFYLVPVMGLIAGYLVLGDKVSITQILGMLTVLFGVFLINKDKFQTH